MAVAIKQTVTPAFLLDQYQADGWSVIDQNVLTPIPVDSSGNYQVAIQLDAFEWLDASFVGIGATTDAVAQLRQLIQAGGSDLYAYAMFYRKDFDALGFKVDRYRIVLCHSIVQLLEAALAILVVAFAAVIFYQYITTGQSPALQDLENLWGAGVQALGSAAGEVGAGVVSPYVWAAVAVGGIAVGWSIIAKQAGVKAPDTSPPKASLGINTGVFNAKLNS